MAKKHKRIIALTNQKGGVSKTSTVANLGAALAERGKKVLVIDMDPQANLTTGLGLNPGDLEGSITEILRKDEPDLGEAIYETALPNLQIVPSDIDLEDVAFSMFNRYNREYILRSSLSENIRHHYDYILIDSPPNLGMLTINVLSAVSEVIIPVSTEYYSLQGLTTLTAKLKFFQRKLNPQLKVTGLLATRYRHNNLSKQVLESLQKGEYPVFNTVIAEAVRVAEAPSQGQTILEYDPNSSSADQYRALAEEIEL